MLRIRSLVAGVLAACLSLLLVVPVANAVAPMDFPPSAPDESVTDSAEVLSRSSRSELGARLEQLRAEKVDARLVTLRRLDYGLSLNQFGEQLLERWSSETNDFPLVLFLIEAQNKQASVVADPLLLDRISKDLLSSTGRTTMSQPLREGDRYRQASLDGITRLEVVLNGGADPGRNAASLLANFSGLFAKRSGNLTGIAAKVAADLSGTGGSARNEGRGIVVEPVECAEHPLHDIAVCTGLVDDLLVVVHKAPFPTQPSRPGLGKRPALPT